VTHVCAVAIRGAGALSAHRVDAITRQLLGQCVGRRQQLLLGATGTTNSSPGCLSAQQATSSVISRRAAATVIMRTAIQVRHGAVLAHGRGTRSPIACNTESEQTAGASGLRVGADGHRTERHEVLRRAHRDGAVVRVDVVGGRAHLRVEVIVIGTERSHNGCLRACVCTH
jgi:hypothetical protein